MEKRPAHPPLNDQEYLIAAICGFGLLLIITAGILMGFGTVDDSGTLRGLVMIGGIIVLGSALLWLVMLRPWENFDDLKTPYYTGHDHHDEHHHDAGASHGRLPAVHDDLDIIEGIGSKAAAALNAEGITSFGQLGSTSPAELKKIMEAHKVKIVTSPATWAIQARAAAMGDLQELQAIKDRINDGKLYEHLLQIEGIGIKIQDALYDAGILTFDDLAAASEDELKAILKAAHLTAKPTTWAKQARFIIDGDLTGLTKYQDTLKGGHES